MARPRDDVSCLCRLVYCGHDARMVGHWEWPCVSRKSAIGRRACWQLYGAHQVVKSVKPVCALNTRCMNARRLLAQIKRGLRVHVSHVRVWLDCLDLLSFCTSINSFRLCKEANLRHVMSVHSATPPTARSLSGCRCPAPGTSTVPDPGTMESTSRTKARPRNDRGRFIPMTSRQRLELLGTRSCYSCNVSSTSQWRFVLGDCRSVLETTKHSCRRSPSFTSSARRSGTCGRIHSIAIVFLFLFMRMPA